MYRPTVRYADVYRDYVNDVFHATTLDRNQIIRLALFVAANSPEYNAILRQYQKADVSLPRPKWHPNQSPLWMEQEPIGIEEGEDVNAFDGRKTGAGPVADVSRAGAPGTDTRREGAIREGVIKTTGGISFSID
jgi:hypothetical protein